MMGPRDVLDRADDITDINCSYGTIQYVILKIIKTEYTM
jgi:hypothetical protein